MKFLARRSILFVSVAALLSACSTSASNGGDSTGASPIPAPTAPPAAVEGEVTVTIAEPLQIRTMDPIADPGALFGTTIWSTVYESLVVVSADGDVAPVLATEWEIDEDATVFTFKLRQGVTFHTGETLEADDVVFSLKRARDNAVPQNAARFANMTDVVAIDAATVQITLENPEPFFLNTLGDPTGLGSSIVPRSAGARGDLAINAVGTGPLKLRSFTPGVGFVLEPFEDYWDDTIEIAYDALEVRFIEDDQSQIAALRAGEIMVAKPSNAATIQGVRNDPLFAFESYESRMFWINFSNVGPTEDLRVNRAVMLAIDRDAIAAAAFLGDAVPASTAPPRVSIGLQPSQLPNHTRDVAAARALLAEAGYPTGIDLTFTYPSRNPTWTTFGEILQASMADAGIRLTLEPLEPSVWVPRLLGQDYDLTMTDQTFYANPVRYIIPRPGWQNPPDQMVPAIAELLAEFQRTSDGATQQELFRRIQTLMAENAYPFVGTVASTLSVVYRPDLVDGVDVANDLLRDARRTYYISLRPRN